MHKKVCTVDTNETQSTSFLLKWLVHSTSTQTARQMAEPLIHQGRRAVPLGGCEHPPLVSTSAEDPGLAVPRDWHQRVEDGTSATTGVKKERPKKSVCSPALHSPLPPGPKSKRSERNVQRVVCWWKKVTWTLWLAKTNAIYSAKISQRLKKALVLHGHCDDFFWS